MLTMVVSLYRRRVAVTVIELAEDHPSLVKEVIARLRAAGEIEVDDLVNLDRIADRWIGIAEGSRRKAQSAHPCWSHGSLDRPGAGHCTGSPVQQIGAFVVQCQPSGSAPVPHRPVFAPRRSRVRVFGTPRLRRA